MDDEIRRREAERQGREAYMRGLPRNPTWPTDFLAAYDRAEDEENDVDQVARNGSPASSSA